MEPQGRGNTPYDPDLNRHVEVHLTPECLQSCLLFSRKRTRKRAAKLLADLLEEAGESAQNPDRIRQLADGIEFEYELTRYIDLALTGPEPRSGF